MKLDLNGNGLEIESSKLDQAMKIGTKYSMDKFRYMCIIAGCDYLPSLPGIGLGKARKLFQLASNPDMTHVSLANTQKICDSTLGKGPVVSEIKIDFLLFPKQLFFQRNFCCKNVEIGHCVLEIWQFQFSLRMS